MDIEGVKAIIAEMNELERRGVIEKHAGSMRKSEYLQKVFAAKK